MRELLYALTGCLASGALVWGAAACGPQPAAKPSAPAAAANSPAPQQAAPAAPSGTGEPIRLGAVVPLTGRYASIGAPVRNGYELAIEDVNAAGASAWVGCGARWSCGCT